MFVKLGSKTRKIKVIGIYSANDYYFVEFLLSKIDFFSALKNIFPLNVIFQLQV